MNTDEIMETLYSTNSDVAKIAAGLKTTVDRINNSNGLWNLLMMNPFLKTYGYL